MENNDSSVGGDAYAYGGCFLEPMVKEIVEKAQRSDHAAQSVDREYYSHFRREAFERRKLAREGVQVTEEDAENSPEPAWPIFGEVVTHGV